MWVGEVAMVERVGKGGEESKEKEEEADEKKNVATYLKDEQKKVD